MKLNGKLIFDRICVIPKKETSELSRSVSTSSLSRCEYEDDDMSDK